MQYAYKDQSLMIKEILNHIFRHFSLFHGTVYVVKAGISHDFDVPVKFIDFRNDGYKRTLRALQEIDKRIIKKAIAKNPFYYFDNLKKYFGQLNSIDQFITDSNYLHGLTIKFNGVENIDSISIEDKLSAIMKLLQSIELCAKKLSK